MLVELDGSLVLIETGFGRGSLLLNQQRLRDLRRDHSKAVRIMSSHDVAEFEGAAHRPITTLPRRPLRA